MDACEAIKGLTEEKWTRKTYHNGTGQYCAIGWLAHNAGWDGIYSHTCERIVRRTYGLSQDEMTNIIHNNDRSSVDLEFIKKYICEKRYVVSPVK